MNDTKSIPAEITLEMTRAELYGAVLSDALDALGYPNQSPRLQRLNRQRVVDVDVPVDLAGVRFSPGDLVIADVDGVVVCPQEVEAEAVRRAWEKVHAENIIRDAIKAGMKAVAAYEKYGVL